MQPLLEKLRHTFPAEDASLLLGILLFPLIGALVNGLFGKRVGKQGVTLMAVFAIAAAFVGSLAGTWLVATQPGKGVPSLSYEAYGWLVLPLRPEGALELKVSFWMDPLSAVMALVVTGVGLIIHLYAIGYMAKDAGYARFFAYLNLFVFSMLVLVLGGSLPVLFVGWEGVGLCSYLLIGFWFDQEKNAAAAKKAFIANRIGDSGLLVAMALLLYYVGRLDWAGIETGCRNLLVPVRLWPPSSLLGGQLVVNQPVYVSAATLVGLLVFLGCAGKSAQIPLYVWLPDAMAGPTPVSALIHAATMVTAGVYLVCRMAPVFVLSPAAMIVVATIGVLTALVGATIALVQNDIKKVLAYSTVSQLGYMFLGVGVGAFAAGLFHVVTHAFFKACLFLGAGSVIHAMHARLHDPDAAQDIRRMGGLRRYLPHTYWTFGLACLAIAGFPLTSGFFSKDEILLKSLTSTLTGPGENGGLLIGGSEQPFFRWPDGWSKALYVGALLAAVLTAFYMFRLFFLVFWGDFRGWEIGPSRRRSRAEEASSSSRRPVAAAGAPRESPWVMTVPLMVLGLGALLTGWLNAHPLRWISLEWVAFEHFVEPVFASASSLVGEARDAAGRELGVVSLSIAASFAGIGAAYWMYVMQHGAPASQIAARVPRLYRALRHQWYVDEVYAEFPLGAVAVLAGYAAWFDRWVVDGVIAGFTSFCTRALGLGLRLLQTGRVQAYAASMVLGVVGSAWFFARPHAAAVAFEDHQAGRYRVSAAEGFGYQYRWDRDGDGRWDQVGFGPERSVAFTLDRAEARTVRLEVKNALGFTAEASYALARPPEDRSGPPLLRAVKVGPDGKARLVPTADPGRPTPAPGPASRPSNAEMPPRGPLGTDPPREMP
jgi:NADH-quinone oxidoreductase subunit L